MLDPATPQDMRAWSRAERARGRRVGFVPTMGALHEGHLLLVDRAKQHTDRVVMSVFVNPLQFGPQEDFAKYPRDVARDTQLAAERGVDCLYVPDGKAMYPEEPLVRVAPGRMADTLEGAVRPGHFAGVLTVVAKLLHMVEPDVAVFGRKDFQQAMLVRRMAADLDFPLEVEIAPTVRELDGLALSSRNAYLGGDQRRSALALSRALRAVEQAWRSGEADPKTPERRAHIERVVALLGEWATAMHVPDAERARWLRAGWLHDALRDENRSDELAHGPRAAARAAQDGEPDRGVLDAVRYHTLGYVHWDDVGRMLYLADFLEPGRPLDPADQAALIARVPRERDAMLKEVARRRIEWVLRSGRPLLPATVAFWNSLASR